MKKMLFFLVLIANVLGYGQRLVLTPGKSENLKAETFVGTDILNHYYYITDNVFFKLGPEGNWQYQNTGLGKITRVDLQNPLKIVLFYENFNTIVTLDNQLNETQRVNLSDKTDTPIIATAVGNAAQNRFWIFNSVTQKIGLYDYLKNSYVEITQPLTGNIRYYETDFNTFQWVDDKQQMHSCDIFGKIATLGKVPVSDKMQFVSNTKIIYQKDDLLYYYNLNGDNATLIDLGKKSFKSFFYKDQILAIFTTEGITNYKITTP